MGCQRNFKTQNTLNSHKLNTHSKEKLASTSTTASSVDKSSKKFKCTSCPKTFRRQNELASHQRVHFKVSAPLVKKLKRMREISAIQRNRAQQERQRQKKQN